LGRLGRAWGKPGYLREVLNVEFLVLNSDWPQSCRERRDGGHRPPLQEPMIENQSCGEFSLRTRNLLVRHYPYFAAMIEDGKWRMAKARMELLLLHGIEAGSVVWLGA
jgi:hypothetical protein